MAVSFAIVLALFFFGFSFSYALIPLIAAVGFEELYYVIDAIPEERAEKFGGAVAKLGRNTYPVYLSHFLVVWYVPALVTEMSGNKIDGVLLWGITLLISALLCIASSAINTWFNKLIKAVIKKLNV